MTESGRYYVLNGGMTASGFTDSYNTEAGTISISEGGNSCGYVAYNAEKFWSGGHNYTISTNNFAVSYLYQMLKHKEPTIMGMRVGSGLPNIQKTVLSNLEISFTSKKEQIKVGDLFKRLDDLISLHQRKCEKLKLIKKAMLEKMFV